MKQLLSFSLMCLSATASTMPMEPLTNPDSVMVDPASPGLGREIYAKPGSTWRFMVNDNLGGGDYDFNDWNGLISFDTDINSGLVSGVLQFTGANSAERGMVFIGSVFAFDNYVPQPFSATANAVVSVGFASISRPENVFYSGHTSKNADGVIHFWTTEVAGTPTPEPKTFATLGAALLGLIGMAKARRAE